MYGTLWSFGGHGVPPGCQKIHRMSRALLRYSYYLYQGYKSTIHLNCNGTQEKAPAFGLIFMPWRLVWFFLFRVFLVFIIKHYFGKQMKALLPNPWVFSSSFEFYANVLSLSCLFFKYFLDIVSNLLSFNLKFWVILALIFIFLNCVKNKACDSSTLIMVSHLKAKWHEKVSQKMASILVFHFVWGNWKDVLE